MPNTGGSGSFRSWLRFAEAFSHFPALKARAWSGHPRRFGHSDGFASRKFSSSMGIFDLGPLSLNILEPHLKLAPVMLWWDSGPCHGRATFLDPLGVPC